MPIIRKKYTVISNKIAQNKSLSFEARGLLLELLSRPDSRIIHKAELMNSTCRRDKLERIIKELRANGFLVLNRVRSNAGKFVQNAWELYAGGDAEKDNIDTKSADQLVKDKPRDRNSAPPEGQQLLSTDSKERTDSEENTEESTKEKTGEKL